jgi:ABC-2 type transport system permease protein
MSARRMLAISRRILFGLLHDPRTMALIFLGPVVAMFVFGLAFSGDVEHVRVAVANLDAGMELLFAGRTSVPERILANIKPGALDVIAVAGEEEGERLVREGAASALIVFPEDMTVSLYRRMEEPSFPADVRVRIRLDRTVFTIAGAVSAAFAGAIMKTVEESGGSLPVRIDDSEPIYGAHARFMDFFVPGVMCFAAFLLTALLTILSFVGERKNGTLDRLLATPVREMEVVGGYAITFSAIGMVQSLLLISVATLAFNVRVEGNIALAFVMVALLCVVSLSLGILLSTLARSELQAIQMMPLIVLPSFLLAGIFWPVEAIPPLIRPLSYLIPPYYAIDACRSIFVRGWGFAKVWIDVAMLALFAAVFLAAAGMVLKRRRA